MNKTEHIVWVDWMRVIAFFMVLVVHSTEPFYLGGQGGRIACEADLWWAAFFDSVVRCCVPLFVVASSYVQFPIRYDALTFFKKRAVRILVPFAIWSLFYAFYWGEPISNLKYLLFNFNYAAGHLWFVYMLVGLYIMMPLLSPWAEKVGRKELSIYIGIWLLTTLIPYLRDALSQHPYVGVSGPTGIPRQASFPLWGECSWNSYGTFYYISGLLGYLLVGLWLRKFGSNISTAKAFAIGVPLYLGGFALIAGGFVRRAYISADGSFPVDVPLMDAVWWETTWNFDTFGVAIMTIGTIMMISRINSDGAFHQKFIAPVARSSYGLYLGHMVVLSAFSSLFIGSMPTPAAIVCTAVCTFLTMSAAGLIVQRIPLVGKILGCN